MPTIDIEQLLTAPVSETADGVASEVAQIVASVDVRAIPSWTIAEARLDWEARAAEDAAAYSARRAAEYSRSGRIDDANAAETCREHARSARRNAVALRVIAKCIAAQCGGTRG